MKLKCPECSGEMTWKGYRPLFPTCKKCKEQVHISKCKPV